MISNHGGCICGGVRYTTSTDPVRVTFCHCRFCQRATGGAYLVEPAFDRAAFKVIEGTPAQYDHVSEGSGKIVTINFCATCGTNLFLEFERFPDVIGMFGGTFDDPNWFPHAGPSAKHIYLDVARHGTIIPAGVDTFRQSSTDNDGRPMAAMVLAEPRIIDAG